LALAARLAAHPVADLRQVSLAQVVAPPVVTLRLAGLLLGLPLALAGVLRPRRRRGADRQHHHRHDPPASHATPSARARWRRPRGGVARAGRPRTPPSPERAPTAPGR